MLHDANIKSIGLYEKIKLIHQWIKRYNGINIRRLARRGFSRSFWSSIMDVENIEWILIFKLERFFG